MKHENLAGRRVVVMGLGRFGGGIAVTRWLADQGATITVTDLASADKLTESVAQLKDLPITFRLGEHDDRDLEGCDLLVVSPAVPKDRSDFVKQARARSIPVTSEMNLFVERCPARHMIGITGSAGKSTTTAMLGAVLEAGHEAGALGRVWVGGNIGHSLLGDVASMTPDDVVVLELSSFQLEDLAQLRWSPSIAVITNLQPNHLDRHGTMEAYTHAKLNVVRFQKPNDTVFIHRHEDALAQCIADCNTPSRIVRFAFDPVFAKNLRVPGQHNRDNAAAAIAVARLLGVADDAIAQGLSRFSGLPHRLEFVAEHKGVRYFNDSKSTTPESSRIALEAFDEPIIMLVGGGDKGMSFSCLGRLLATRAKATLCYGQTGDKLYREVVQHLADASATRVARAEGFEDAVHQAATLADPGDVVVLSPACTSYDMFSNYEQRGQRFRELVGALDD